MKLNELDLAKINWQFQSAQEILSYDYSKGVYEVLLSGAIGSSKTTLLAYLNVMHCLIYPKAYAGIGRLTLDELKDTLLAKILELTEDIPIKSFNKTTGTLEFDNGSIIDCFSWKDKNYKKFRSYQFTMFTIEELSENNDKDVYDEIYQRLGRRTDIPMSLFISATNPDNPEHWAYKHFIINKTDVRKTYYSVTEDNPFLPTSYIENLKKNLDPKMARRKLFGEWLSINQENVYYSYDPEINFKKTKYTINPNLPIYCSWDFNVGAGKPMSMSLSQYDKAQDTFHFFDEIVIQGIRTLDTCDELQGKGYLDLGNQIIITGDATGKANSANSKHTNYDIITEYIANYKTAKGEKVYYTLDLPSKNPPIRTRHETVNAYLCNSKMERRLFVYENCKTIDEGLRLVKLKANSDYIEDDSKYYQHVTTSLGYNVCQVVAKLNYQSTPQLFKR